MCSTKTQGRPKYFNPMQVMRVEEDHNNSKKLPEQANPIKKGSALLSYHQFLLNFVAMKNSCHKAR
jgi:hypothetical protein